MRARRRALAVTHGVVAALREEYALLLPESLPFLAELLEDEDAGAHPFPCCKLVCMRRHARIVYRRLSLSQHSGTVQWPRPSNQATLHFR